MERRNVLFFNQPGGYNTPQVMHAVRSRIKKHDITKILVASESGRLALEFKKELPDQTVVCVTFDEKTRRKYKKLDLMKKELAANGITIVETVKEPLSRELVFRNWWDRKEIVVPGESADLFWMTLICVGGHGLRTAVEIVFMAVEAGAVQTGERVLSVAGTVWGADSALVMKASKFEDAVGGNPLSRMKIEEILAMPRETEWHGYG